MTAAAAMQVVGERLEAGVHTMACPAVTRLDLLHHATAMGVQVQEYTGVARATSW